METVFLPKPPQCVYTSCYCEENVWKLCDYVRSQHSEDELNKCYAVFISNPRKTVPLWKQRASQDPDNFPVVWDYHVIFLYWGDAEHLIYDLDTVLPFPSTFIEYVTQTFRSDENIRVQFHRYFRIIEAKVYLQKFASDRSHMRGDNGEWMSPPPSYPPIQSPESTNNIADFISMDQSIGFGEVLDLPSFIQKYRK